MTSDPTRRIFYLDIYRGIACLLVYFYHTAVNIHWFGIPFFGYNGVFLFFVLSGYLMSGKFVKALSETGHMPPTKSYFLRRFLRIYPPFLVSLAAFVALRVVTGIKIPSIESVLVRAGLIFNYFDQFDYYAINVVYWSLAIELQFYLILPLAVWFISRCLPRPSLFRLGCFAGTFLVVGVVSRAVEHHWIDHTGSAEGLLVRIKWVTSHLDLFGAGIAIRSLDYLIDTKGWQRSQPLGLTLIATGLAGLVGISIWAQDDKQWQTSPDCNFAVWGPILTCLGFSLLIWGSGMISWKRGSHWVIWKGLAWIGTISYSIYLYHTGILGVFNKVFHPENWNLSPEFRNLLIGLACLPITLLVGWLAFHLFEKPFFKKRTSQA